MSKKQIRKNNVIEIQDSADSLERLIQDMNWNEMSFWWAFAEVFLYRLYARELLGMRVICRALSSITRNTLHFQGMEPHVLN